MRIYTLFRATALILVAAAILPVATAGLTHRDTVVPVVFSISPNQPYAGQTVSIDVGLNQTTPTDQVVDILTQTSGNWSSLPSQVVVPAGHSDVVFNAAISKNASGTLQASASCNSGSVSQSLTLAAR